mmetsp:Transcript_14264/g.34639  ORF Transcript_14264/g.34639 Transcript_14264/m.34639 type:complete len:82 (-) Transcript_14264:155-400(-)
MNIIMVYAPGNLDLFLITDATLLAPLMKASTADHHAYHGLKRSSSSQQRPQRRSSCGLKSLTKTWLCCCEATNNANYHAWP